MAAKQSFVDLGCGNGLLVHILSSEGVRLVQGVSRTVFRVTSHLAQGHRSFPLVRPGFGVSLAVRVVTRVSATVQSGPFVQQEGSVLRLELFSGMCQVRLGNHRLQQHVGFAVRFSLENPPFQGAGGRKGEGGFCLKKLSPSSEDSPMYPGRCDTAMLAFAATVG